MKKINLLRLILHSLLAIIGILLIFSLKIINEQIIYSSLLFKGSIINLILIILIEIFIVINIALKKETIETYFPYIDNIFKKKKNYIIFILICFSLFLLSLYCFSLIELNLLIGYIGLSIIEVIFIMICYRYSFIAIILIILDGV